MSTYEKQDLFLVKEGMRNGDILLVRKEKER